MKYIRYEAPPEARLRFHFRDKFGNDIKLARDYDPTTGVGHRLIHEDSEELEEFFMAQGSVELDGIVNPTQEQLDAIYEAIRAGLGREARDALVQKVIRDARYEEGSQTNTTTPS